MEVSHSRHIHDNRMEGKIEAILLDLSGTIHIEDECVIGALEAVTSLMNIPNLKVHFVSNTTLQSRHSLMKRLRTLGFHINSEQITTSLSVSIEILNSFGIKRPYLLVSEDAANEFRMSDFDCTYTDDEVYDAVVVGLAPELFDYMHLNRAFRILNRLQRLDEKVTDKPRLIAIHKARYYATKEDLSLGPGAFVSALEYATGMSALVVGKPSKTFFHQVLHKLQVVPDRAVMIGDDPHDDVVGAQLAGLRGWLVRTGKSDKKINGMEIESLPDRTFDSVVQAIQTLLREIKIH